MSRAAYPRLWQMFGAFFYQDWDTEGDDWPDLVRNFAGGQPQSELDAAAAELGRLVNDFPDDEALDRELLNVLGCSYLPRPDLGGPTVRVWLGLIAEFLRGGAGTAKDGPRLQLRPGLLPPPLDRALVARLADLAAGIDGAAVGRWEDDVAEFNRLADTHIPFAAFQGVYGGDGHEAFVRRMLYRRQLAPDPVLTHGEMAEIVSRIRALADGHDFYLELFSVNCRHPGGTDLIYWPDLVPELPRGREPTSEEIADVALRDPAEPNASPVRGGR